MSETTTVKILSEIKRGKSLMKQIVDDLYIRDIGVRVLSIGPYRVDQRARRILVHQDCCGEEVSMRSGTLRARINNGYTTCGKCRSRNAVANTRSTTSKDQRRLEERRRAQNKQLHVWAHRCMSGLPA